MQPGDALETELERTRRVIVMDDVADGLWLDLILTLRFAYTPSPLDESPSFIEKREDFAHLVSSATLTIDPSRDAPRNWFHFTPRILHRDTIPGEPSANCDSFTLTPRGISIFLESNHFDFLCISKNVCVHLPFLCTVPCYHYTIVVAQMGWSSDEIKASLRANNF